MIQFTIPGKPVAQKRSRKGKYGNWYDPCAEEKRVLRWQLLPLKQAHRIPLQGSLGVDLVFYGCDKSADNDNLQKFILDACNGIIWFDDRQITKIVSKKFADSSQPRTEVRVFKTRRRNDR